MPDSQPSVTDQVSTDLRAREQKGIETYGVTLPVHSDRDHLTDAYEEALDLAQYLKAELLRRRDLSAQIAELKAVIRALLDVRTTAVADALKIRNASTDDAIVTGPEFDEIRRNQTIRYRAQQMIADTPPVP